jgi:hypothetical protein
MRLGWKRLSLAGLVLCGCDAQVTSSYRGERMVEIHGNIVAETPLRAARAALVWWTAGGPLATPATTEGRFPSAFTLSVYRRPPEEALFNVDGAGEPDGPVVLAPWNVDGEVACRAPAGPGFAPGGGRLAIATIAAVAEDGGAVIGLASGYALVFVASGTALSPGYHLMLVDQAAAADGAFTCGPELFLYLHESPQGIDRTEIEVRIPTG